MMVAGCCSCRVAVAQTDAGAGNAASPGSASGTPAASGSGATAPGASSGFGSGFGSSQAPAGGASSSFGAAPTPTVPEPGTGATSGGASTTGSQSSLQGSGFGTAKTPPAAPPSFTLPGFYGASATTLTAGEGRLARPRFRYNVSLSFGYDDNTQQTPTTTTGTPDIFQEVLVDPGTPPMLRQVPVFSTTRIFIPGGGTAPVTVQTGTRLELVPGTAPTIRRVLVQAAVPAQKRAGSAVTRGGAGVDIQLYSARSLFTFDLSGGADHYWSRPTEKQTDYNGALVFSFLYRITPRMQFTAQLNGAYLTQPDLSRINTPQQQTGGAYINTNAKIDLSYRWSPRFTTVVSLSDNTLLFQEKTQQSGDYNEIALGTEFRYLYGPRLTLLAEGRYDTVSYSQDTARDSMTLFFLLGAEAQFSQRLTGSLRFGESLRSFTESGDSSATPYLEGTVGYRLGPTSVVNFNTRFGFEEPTSAGTQRLVYRTGLSYSQAFSPRLSGAAGINYLHDTSSSSSSNPGGTGQNSLETVTNTYDANLQLNYLVTRNFSLNANYSFTTLLSEEGVRDYYRSRIFFGGAYSF